MDLDLEKFKVTKNRVSDQITGFLKQAILDGKLKTGDKLPPEEKIASQFQVSKVAVREALRELETEGLIEKHRGMFGGSFVAAPELTRIGDSVISCYQFGTLTQEELVEFRQMFEPVLIKTATQRRTPEDLQALRANIEECEALYAAGTPDVGKQVHFHLLIARACHNQLFIAVMEAVATLFKEIAGCWDLTDADARSDLDYSHKFYDCILRGHTVKAQQLMVEHFDYTKRFVQAYRAKQARMRQDQST